MYLGDGCLSIHKRAVYLQVAFDAKYQAILDECRAAMAAVLPYRRSHMHAIHGGRCLIVRSYGREWLCLFPQHGPGRKHRRRISLEDWQEAITREHTGAFLRGLIHSDGWRGVNRVRVKGRDYAYSRYQFSNRSDDIRRIFTDACDRLAIEWRRWGRWHISIARRGSVARLDEFVGPKR